MDKITVVGLASDRDAVLDTLMRTGVLEIISREDEAEPVSSADRIELEQRLNRLEQAVLQMDRRFPPQKGSLFKSKVDISESEFMVSAAAEAETLEQLERWEKLVSTEAGRKQDLISLQEGYDQISYWQDLDLDLSVSGTQRTEISYGIFSDLTELERLEAQLAEDAPETQIIRLRTVETGVLAAVIMLREDAAHTRLLIQAADFHAVPAALRTDRPNKIISALQSRIGDTETEINHLFEQMSQLAEKRSSFWLLEDYYRVILERDTAAADLSRSASTFWLRGWVPHEQAADLIKTLQAEHDVAISCVAGQRSENYPIKLKNNPLNRNFEIILAMFGAPNAEEADPTPVMAPFYMLLFGMMLSDVGYGLALVGLCALLLWKFKVKGELQEMTKMLFISGISSVAWGAVFGGFFGDLLTVVSEGRINFPALWFDPMSDAMKLMIFSMLFGVVHLFFGMGLQIKNAHLQGNLIDGLLDVVPWYMIVGGLLLYAGGTTGALGAASDISSSIGIYLALAGAAVVVLFGGREAKNPIVRLFKGIVSLYDVTGFLGDILSYTRILALVLATSVIAIVVNKLGFLLGPTPIGYIMFILVGLLGHTLNLALSGLSAYVHASRLQYVEMFGKFFEGGGQFFKPLRRKTKYYRIQNKAEQERQQGAA